MDSLCVCVGGVYIYKYRFLLCNGQSVCLCGCVGGCVSAAVSEALKLLLIMKHGCHRLSLSLFILPSTAEPIC